MPAAARPAATDYYVDALLGNDANKGTSPDSAWRTLNKINGTTFQFSDSILFRAGSVWNGQLWPKGSGTAGHPTVDVDAFLTVR